MAAAFKFPVTMHRGFNLRLLTDITSPLHRNCIGHRRQLLSLSVYFAEGRTDYVAFVYPLTETGDAV
jgi:hypothetical protein